jgi:signal transduction histidine kinase
MHQPTGAVRDAERIHPYSSADDPPHQIASPCGKGAKIGREVVSPADGFWKRAPWIFVGALAAAVLTAAMPQHLLSFVANLLNSEIARTALPAAFGLAAWVAAQRPKRQPGSQEDSFPVLTFGERSEGFLEFAEKVLLEAAERERQRIRQHLDVGLARQLEGISCLSRILENRLAGEGRPEAKDAARVGRLVEQALADARSLATSTYPSNLESEGLEAALNKLGAAAEEHQVYCQVLIDAPLPALDESATLQIFRMVEMMVNRAIRHGSLHYILIELSAQSGQLALSVTDRVTSGSFPGLESHETHLLRARARSMKATIDIERRVYGCRLICVAPLSYVACA